MGDDVVLAQPRCALQRGAVEADALLERRFELRDGDREALEQAEHVDEPEAHELHAPLLDRAQHELAVTRHALEGMGASGTCHWPVRSQSVRHRVEWPLRKFLSTAAFGVSHCETGSTAGKAGFVARGSDDAAGMSASAPRRGRDLCVHIDSRRRGGSCWPRMGDVRGDRADGERRHHPADLDVPRERGLRRDRAAARRAARRAGPRERLPRARRAGLRAVCELGQRRPGRRRARGRRDRSAARGQRGLREHDDRARRSPRRATRRRRRPAASRT